MTSPEMGLPASPHVQPKPVTPTTPVAPAAIAGPCGPVRADVDTRCADAERLAGAAVAHDESLRDARREYAEVTRQRDADALLRDRRLVAQEKSASQADYHSALMRATDRSSVQDAAAEWMRRIDQINRQARVAGRRVDGLIQKSAQLERALPGLELAADAARISAESAQVACLDARRALAACEEESQRKVPGQNEPLQIQSSAVAGANAIAESPQAPETGPTPDSAFHALMGGDRQVMLGLALNLAEETGIEAGRLQLLLLEFREQVAARALDVHEFAFPQAHPFWSQFSPDGARRVANGFSSMGYKFDGVDGWVEGRAPTLRDLALALSYCGYDPRTLRRPAGQAAIDALWQGTRVLAQEYLLASAPNLALPEIVGTLGPRAGGLGDLWDIWGRVRPLLLRPL